MKANKIQTLIGQICKLNDVKIQLNKLNTDIHIPKAISRINRAISAIKMSLVRDDFYVFDDGKGTVSCVYLSIEDLSTLLNEKKISNNDISVTIEEDDKVSISGDNTLYTLEGTSAYEFVDLLERALKLKTK